MTSTVRLPSQAVKAVIGCTRKLPAWFDAGASNRPGLSLSCAQSLEMASLVAATEWECQQAAGEETADAAAAACRALVNVLEQTVIGMLLGREVIVSDAWMTVDPDDDLERPTVHHGGGDHARFEADVGGGHRPHSERECQRVDGHRPRHGAGLLRPGLIAGPGRGSRGMAHRNVLSPAPPPVWFFWTIA
ncbi:hypothetical protein ACIRL0_36015 [Streptomyces sp. NPDC102365]|uniref:hypothetical protein n=1 Tax=Streptomyces sp. NPDC102365 TaxID=3366162 RepID=UPI003830C046